MEEYFFESEIGDRRVVYFLPRAIFYKIFFFSSLSRMSLVLVVTSQKEPRLSERSENVRFAFSAVDM